jgi:hypothetical protein
MTAEYALSSRTELLSGVVRRLHEEFPAVASDQVVRCVQIAREFVKSSLDPSAMSAADPSEYVSVVEAQARSYLAKFQAIRTRSAAPAPVAVTDPTATTLPAPAVDAPTVVTPTVVDANVIELGAAERRRAGRHRRFSGVVNR